MEQQRPTDLNKNRPKPPFPKEKIDPPGIEEDMRTEPQWKSPKYKGSEKLKNKTALITGGDSGIGRAVAVLFAREGADVVITCMDSEVEDAEVTCEAIRSEGRKSSYIVTDLTSDGACEAVVQKTLKDFSQIDILVNNAAFQKHLESIDDLSVDQFEHTFKTNVFGYFRMVKAVLPHMPKGGCILNTASVLAYEGSGSLIDYSATKGAIHTLTKSLAENLMARSIRVNAVAPGPVWTPLNPAERDSVKDFGSDTLYGRPAQPEEIAPAYVYLASSITSNYVTGETINIFGTTSGGN